ncbi:MAG: hypothetical protein AAGI37_03335 [Planctomycetota bacterium]
MSKHDDFNELEGLLADLPVREPSQMLDTRVASTLDAATPTPSRSKLPWLAIAAAVLLVGSVTLLVTTLINPKSDIDLVTGTRLEFDVPEPSDQANAGPTIQLATNQPETVNLTWSRDIAEEVRYTPSGRPYRAVVEQTFDHRIWIDPETGTTLQQTTPSETLYITEQPVY